MNTYIKQLIESFFDDIEDDILDTDNTLFDHNIKTVLNTYIKQIKELSRTFTKIQKVSYNEKFNTCKFIVNGILIIKTDNDIKVFLQIFNLLSNIGCKTVYIEEVSNNSNTCGLLISPKTHKNTFNGYNIVIDTSSLQICNTTIKNVQCSVNLAILLRCNLQYSDTCAINATNFVKVLMCMNIHNFLFIENNVRYMTFIARNQKLMPTDKSFNTIPKSCERLVIKLGCELSWSIAPIKFDKDNTLNGIENINYVILMLAGKTLRELRYTTSHVSIEKFLVNSDKLKRTLLLCVDSENEDILFKMGETELNISPYDNNIIPNSVLNNCKNNKIYYLNKYITATNK